MGSERMQRLVFGEVAADYDRHRPHYPDELFDLLLDDDVDRVLDAHGGRFMLPYRVELLRFVA